MSLNYAIEVNKMVKKARLCLYLEDEQTKTHVKIAAAKRGISATAYCEEAIKEKLKREGTLSDEERQRRKALMARMDKLREEIGPIGVSTSELVKEGRRR